MIQALILRTPAEALHSFYNGGSRERAILLRAYHRLVKHIDSIYAACSNFSLANDPY